MYGFSSNNNDCLLLSILYTKFASKSRWRSADLSHWHWSNQVTILPLCMFRPQKVFKWIFESQLIANPVRMMIRQCHWHTEVLRCLYICQWIILISIQFLLEPPSPLSLCWLRCISKPCAPHELPCPLLSPHIWLIWKVGPAYDALMLEVVAKHPTWLGVPGFPSPVSYSLHRFLHFGWENWWCLLVTLGLLSDTYLLNLTMDRHVGWEVFAAWPLHYVDYFSVISVLECPVCLLARLHCMSLL